MGRTIPSFRIASVMEKEEWKSFRKALDKKDRKIFDDMFDISILYNSASAYSAKYIRIHPIFMSIIFHHYKKLTEISERIKQIKNGDSQQTLWESLKLIRSSFPLGILLKWMTPSQFCNGNWPYCHQDYIDSWIEKAPLLWLLSD